MRHLIVDLNQMKSREDTFISTFIYTYSKVSPPSGERPSVFLPFYILMSFDLSGERPFVSYVFLIIIIIRTLHHSEKAYWYCFVYFYSYYSYSYSSVSKIKFCFATLQNTFMHIVLLPEYHGVIWPCVLKTRHVSLLLMRARKSLLLLLLASHDTCVFQTFMDVFSITCSCRSLKGKRVRIILLEWLPFKFSKFYKKLK